MKHLITATLITLTVGTAQAGIPSFNGTCPGGYELHADQGGPVFINGKEAKIKKINNDTFDATGSGITLSIGTNPDGTLSLMYTGKHGANGICQTVDYDKAIRDIDKKNEAAPSAPAATSSEVISQGNMPAHCRGEASSMYGVKPMYIKTGKLTHVKGSGYTIKGNADLGDQGMKPFSCGFDNQGHFTGVMSLVDEGKL